MTTRGRLGYTRIAARDTKKTFYQLGNIKPPSEFFRTAAECLFYIIASPSGNDRYPLQACEPGDKPDWRRTFLHSLFLMR
ncbi:Uncharacterised protein [Corynebacterium renale]|nr:Uncharacterised protein [Corynebacterium renale]STD01469.1 Uncharacterised protein [Corynebacterium renale]